MSGENALGGFALKTSEESPPIFRLTEHRDFLNPHYFHMVKVPRLAVHDSASRIHLALLEDPTFGTVDDPFRSPLRE